MNWTDDIKTKMNGFEMEPPKGLKESILPAAIPARKHYWGYAAAFAIAAAAALLIIVVRPETPVSGSQDMLAQASEPVTAAVDASVVAAQETEVSEESDAAPVTRRSSMVQGATAVPVTLDADREATAAYEETEQLSVTEPEPECEVREPAGKPAMEVFDPEVFSESVKVKKKRRTEIGVLSSYLAQAGSAQGGSTAGPQNSPNAVRWDESPMMTMLLSSPREEPAVFSHHLPVKLGMSVEYQLSDSWFVGSGINYTMLISDIWRGKSHSQKIGVQKLDYVGIPVSARFEVLSSRWFRTYLTAGVSADKCVSNRRENLFGPSGTETTGTDRYDEHPFQFSAMAGMGAALRLSSWVSIYAEPALTWYADDGSSLDTFFKERSLTFSVNAGLRFTLGDK